MLETAASLLAFGLLTIIYVSRKLVQDKQHRELNIERIPCDAPSPDNQVRCNEELGHYGWHKNAGTEWFGDTWECDHWANTQEQPLVTPELLRAAQEETFVSSSLAEMMGLPPAVPGQKMRLGEQTFIFIRFVLKEDGEIRMRVQTEDGSRTAEIGKRPTSDKK